MVLPQSNDEKPLAWLVPSLPPFVTAAMRDSRGFLCLHADGGARPLFRRVSGVQMSLVGPCRAKQHRDVVDSDVDGISTIADTGTEYGVRTPHAAVLAVAGPQTLFLGYH